MKKFGFIKKVTAAATAAAMVASLGISVFATPGTAGSDDSAGTTISITNVDLTQVDSTDVYKVRVDYQTTATNSIGMTMLTYKQTENTDLSLGTGYGSNMTIIGVDQTAPVSGDSTTPGTGYFEFNITSDSSTAGGYYLPKGTTALIALSSDGNVSGETSTPAFATLTIPKDASYAPAVVVGNGSGDDPVSLAANLTSEQIQNTIADALATKTVKVSVYENASSETAVETDIPLYGSNVTIGTFTESTENAGEYTGTVTINSIDGVKVPDTGIPVSVTVKTVKTAVDAVKASAVEGMTADADTVNKFKLAVGADGNADENAVVTNNFVGKKVTLTDSTGTVTGTVAITDGMVTRGDYAVDVAKPYTITIPSDATISNSLLTIPSAGITVTVDVTVSTTAVINSITLSGDPINVTVTKGADDGATKAAIEAALRTAIADRTFTVTDTKGGSATVALGKVTYGWTVSGTGTAFTATMNVTAVDSDVLSGSEFRADSLKITTPNIAITVNEKPAVKYGDVDNDGKWTISDVGLTFDYAFGLGTLTEDQIVAANVDGDAKVTISDVGLIFDKAFKLGDFPNGTEPFPVEK